MQDFSKYTEIFITDSREGLGEMNQILLQLEKDYKNLELINSLFRKVHSLKGMAKMMGYDRLSELCHALENPLSKMREGKSFLTQAMTGLLFSGLYLLENLVNEAVTASPPQIDYQNFIQKLSEEKSIEVIPPANGKLSLSYRLPPSISVDTQKLDELINIIGEMIIRRNRLIELTRSIVSPELEEEIHFSGNLINELYSKILTIRMVRASVATAMLQRIVRDVAINQGKEIDFQTEGDKEIELDSTVLNELMAPLIHLIRNAVDHGVEVPALREAWGKGKGKVHLRFLKEKDMVRIEVEDDGQGINIAQVKQEALTKRIITKDKADLLTDEEIVMLLCTPGFSTSEKVTDISGRGVGLDVVKEKVDKLGGSMQVFSNYGAGTKFILKIPTTSHILFALLVSLNSNLFAIPLPKVLAITSVNGKGSPKSFTFQKKEIQLIHLRDLLKISHSSQKEPTSLPVIISEIEGKKVGLTVDALVKIDQIFVKPLGKLLDKISGFYGATIFGDGRMVLVLDVERLRFL